MDHYKVLGITNDASKAEIKDAFRKLAIKFHPDKHSQSSDSIKQNALLRFKQVSEAYEVLIDDRKRAQYNISRSSGTGFAGGTRGSGAGYGRYNHYSNAGKGSYYGYGPVNGSYGSGKGSYYGPRYSETPRSGPGLHYSFRFVNIPSMGSFIRNLAVASVLCAGVVAIEACGETLWKVQNSGKSFEETIDSIEKIKAEKGKR